MNAEDFYKQEFEKDYELIKDIRNTPVFNLDSVLKFAELYAVKGNTVSSVVFLLIETDESHGIKGVYGVFDTKEKADAELKKWCGNDKWCSFTVQQWSVK